jgi:hypothetical protein
MKKWEYKCIFIFGNGETATRILNSYGQEGWELVCVVGIFWNYFKREIT